MEIFSWSPDFGLPSWHPECLSIIAYSRLKNLDASITVSDNPVMTKNGDLPYVRIGPRSESYFNVSRVSLRTTWLFSRNSSNPKIVNSFNEFLSNVAQNSSEPSDAVAYSKMIEANLRPAYALTFWVDSKNFCEFTRPWYAKKLGFPLSFIYPNKYRRKALDLIQVRIQIQFKFSTQ